ncbi:hypothetical protein [Micromonospora sp. IBHARD004]|uniref:hypothetical protein n=1 Tax=Micromonospora sp. IBHARD004 TaxID=3457764 RepID=UPI00405813FF
MTEVVRMGSREADTRELELTAQPTQITTGGIVLLVATTTLQGAFDVTWRIEGPVVLSPRETAIALLGATTVTGNRVTFETDDPDVTDFQIRATLDTSQLAVGSWTVSITLTRVGISERTTTYTDTADPIRVVQAPFASGDDVSVSLRRAAVAPTADQALWVAIRTSTNALGFDNYIRFMDRVWCDGRNGLGRGRKGSRDTREELRRTDRRTALPFPNVDRYRLLKAATEVFIMINCRTDHGDFRRVDLDEESARLNRDVRRGDLEAQYRRYLVETPDGRGGELDVLPYLGLVRRKLGDVPVVGSGTDDDDAAVCYGILAEKLTNPCFLELIHSYWLERSGLVQTINAINWRFQNRAPVYPGRDPLAGLDVDPLRPLNNILWGWAQDEQHRLTEVRRDNEYQHLYGLSLGGPDRRVADARSRFMGAFHSLLAECMEFYDRDDNTVVIANGFDVLNGLKETHLLLTQGAHNQYGDLPWTARHEMLMSQWILSRPEMRDFLPSRVMVDSPEAWIDAVEGMNRLQGWSDISVLHFRDLAAYGEQLLLSIRFGAWTSVSDPDQAANWARYFRREVQQYCHAYRAVTGRGMNRRPETSSNGYARRRPYPTYRG